jgi:hypothetical protein
MRVLGFCERYGVAWPFDLGQSVKTGKEKTMRITASEFEKLDLWAHSFLRDVPLHDTFAIDLPGGGQGRTMCDIRALLPAETAIKANLLVAALFTLRFFVGRILGWDANRDELDRDSYLHRLGAEDRAQALITPGTPDGPFRLLQMLPRESVCEVQNATVHAFLCQALQEEGSGYRLYWGIYVKPVSRFTPVYMALIKPFRHLVVYPAILNRLRKAWIQRYATACVSLP